METTNKPQFFSIKALMSTRENIPFYKFLTGPDELTSEEMARLDKDIDIDDIVILQWKLPLDSIMLGLMFREEWGYLNKTLLWGHGSDSFEDYNPDYLLTLISILENMAITFQKDYPDLWGSIRGYILTLYKEYLHCMNRGWPNWLNDNTGDYEDYQYVDDRFDDLITNDDYSEALICRDNTITFSTAFSPKLIME